LRWTVTIIRDAVKHLAMGKGCVIAWRRLAKVEFPFYQGPAMQVVGVSAFSSLRMAPSAKWPTRLNASFADAQYRFLRLRRRCKTAKNT
jgi:hypothetical protein